MPWEERTVSDQRAEFVARVIMGEESMSELCRTYGISRPTGYKWVERYRNGESLCDRSHAPFTRPFRTDPEMEKRILEVRNVHKTWGPRKIHRHLMDKGVADALPAPSTIGDILKRHGQIDEVVSAQHTPWKRFERDTPNALWQMDDSGRSFALFFVSGCQRKRTMGTNKSELDPRFRRIRNS